jgi:hypothetical protein
MGTEMVPETLEIFNQLTRLIACEDFIKMSRIKKFRNCELYTINNSSA